MHGPEGAYVHCPMANISGIKGFTKLWNEARADESPQSSKVSYGELKGALQTLGQGKLSRQEAKFAASTFASDPYLTAPAKREAFAFLQLVGAGKPLDSTTIEAIKGEFSLRAVATFRMLEVPGRLVKNTVDLPPAVAAAAAKTAEPDDGGEWASVQVRKATLAGQSVFIVHHSELDGSSDLEKVEVFSAAGKSLAKGNVWDAMAGFSWDR